MNFKVQVGIFFSPQNSTEILSNTVASALNSLLLKSFAMINLFAMIYLFAMILSENASVYSMTFC